MARFHFLACVIITSCAVAGRPPKYALKGQKVNLTSDITPLPDEILWKHNGNKVVEFNSNQELVFDTFKDRITLDWHSAQLTISDLRIEDSGEYELEVNLNGKWQSSYYHLNVVERVPKPSISCEVTDGSGSNASGTLVCTAEPRQSYAVRIEWTPQRDGQTGAQLRIPLGDEFKDEEYICHVSNPLSSENATFSAKDCFPDKGSPVALIAGLVIGFIFLLLVLGILYCQQKHKACFAPTKRDDLENQRPPGRRAGSDNEKAADDERSILLARAPTLPSTQPLGHQRQLDAGKEMNQEKQENGASPSPPQRSESTSDLDQSRSAHFNGDAVTDRLREPSEEKIPDCSNVPNPAAVVAAINEGTASEPESSTASENPGLKEEAEKDEEEKSPPADDILPAAHPPSTSSQISPKVTATDVPGEHDEDSDHIREESNTNFRGSDSSGIGKRNESDDTSEDEEQPSTIPEQEESEKTPHDEEFKLSGEENHTDEDKKQEMDKTVSASENESDSVGDGKESDEEHDLYLATSQMPPSPTSTKSDSRNSSASLESAEAAQTDPEHEEEAKVRNDSGEVSEDEG